MPIKPAGNKAASLLQERIKTNKVFDKLEKGSQYTGYNSI